MTRTRIAVGVEYDGARFCGWQVQPGQRTIQACLEEALSRVADEPISLQCAGRTDTGVHAMGQVAHFDARARRPERSWVLGANSHLPADISVRWAREVPADFDARYSALRRTYRYLILNRMTRPALLRQRVYWECRPLDAAVMHEAGLALLGEHDFSAFRGAGCQAKTAVRRIERLEVSRMDDLVRVEVTANAFLLHMVRNIAGTLLAVGLGQRPVGWVGDVLRGRNRACGGVTAPGAGLYLIAVEYPVQFGIPISRSDVGVAGA
jgi:tRNA pseudouridine38-40 synthase